MICKNPFNIRNKRYHKWIGQIASREGFCVFSDEKYCILAAATIIKNYYNHGLVTPRQLINRFVFSSEYYSDNIDNCISFVCTCYLPPDEPLHGQQQFVRFLERMSAFLHNPIPWLRISEVLFEFDFKFPNFLCDMSSY